MIFRVDWFLPLTVFLTYKKYKNKHLPHINKYVGFDWDFFY